MKTILYVIFIICMILSIIDVYHEEYGSANFLALMAIINYINLVRHEIDKKLDTTEANKAAHLFPHSSKGKR